MNDDVLAVPHGRQSFSASHRAKAKPKRHECAQNDASPHKNVDPVVLYEINVGNERVFSQFVSVSTVSNLGHVTQQPMKLLKYLESFDSFAAHLDRDVGSYEKKTNI